MISAAPLDVQPLLDRLISVPFDVADNVTIVEHDLHVEPLASGDHSVFGSLVVKILGKRIKLRALPQKVAADPFVFQGEMVEPLVDYGEYGRFSLTTFQIEMRPPATKEEKAWSFDVTGRGRVEFHGHIAGETGSLVVEGHLRAVRLAGTTDQYLRMDFDDDAALRLSIAGGVKLVMSPKRLFFLVDDRGNVDLELRVSCKMLGFPYWLENALDGEIDADVVFNGNGLVITAGAIREHSKLNLSSLGIADRGLLAGVDEIDFSAKHVRIDVGNRIECRLDVEVKVPAPLLSFAEPQFSFRVTATTKELTLQLLSSPLSSLHLKPSKDGSLAARFNLGAFGEMSFAMPQWHMDWASRCLVAEGQLSFRDLRLPLGPIISLLKAGGHQTFAERLPESLVLQPFALTGIAATLTDFITQALGTGTFAQRAREELNRLLQQLDRLPRRLRESFLHVDVPKELAFRVEITTDFGARLSFSPPPSPLTGETTPLHLLAPHHGPSGPELYGVTLYRLSIGQIRAGSLFTVEIDAEIDRFELLPIALAMTMSPENLFASPDGLEQRFICRDVFSVLAFPGGTPVLVPLFFQQLGFVYSGLDGLAAGISFSLPAPKVDFAGLARWVTGMNAPAHAQNEVGLTLTMGPAYVQLPPYLGGKCIGSKEDRVTVRASADISRVVSAVQSLHIDTLLASIPVDFGTREIELNLGPTYRKASRLWATVAEPALFLSAKALEDPALSGKAGGLAGKFKAMTGHLADGLSGLRTDKSETFLRVRFVGVQSTGIHFVIVSPGAIEKSGGDEVIELKWDNLLGSAAGLAARTRMHCA